MRAWLARRLRLAADWLQRDEIARTLDNLYADSDLRAALEREAVENQERAARAKVGIVDPPLRGHGGIKAETRFQRRLRTLR